MIDAVGKSQPFEQAGSSVLLENAMAVVCLQMVWSVDVRDAEGCTPLHWAARTGNINAAVWLLQHRASPSATNYFQATPLHYAALSPDLDQQAVISFLLLAKNTNVHATDKNQQTALHLLVARADLTAKSIGNLQALLHAGADVRSADNLGNTPLHCAAASCNRFQEVMLSMLKHGADPTATNIFGDNVVHTAAAFGNLSALQTLVNPESDMLSLLSDTNHAGMTPLQLTVAVGWSAAAVELLLSFDTEQSSMELLELFVRTGWRQEIGSMLITQCHHDVKSIWSALRLLAPVWQDNDGRRVMRRPKLQLRFVDTVTPANCMLRQNLLARLVKLAESSGYTSVC